jgi:outer membrane receptor for ferrienterochelin and colicins
MGGRVCHMARACALALGSAAALAAPAASEPIDYGALEALFDEPVTLSATGAPQRVTEAPVNMTIISQAEIRRSGAIDLPGVLERLAHIDVMRSTRGQADVAIRGYNTTLSPRLLVLLNGRQVYLDIYGVTNWDLIPVQLSEIRQIEVVTGPNTALFGFNAVAGVVNIITFDPVRDDVDEVSLSAGTSDYAAGAVVWSVRPTEQLGIRLSAGGYAAEAWDNDAAAAAASLGAISTVDPQARTVALNLGYNLSSATRLNAEATWARGTRLNRHGQGLFDYPFETSSLKLGLATETALGLVNAQIYSNALDVALENRTSVASAEIIGKPGPAHTLRLAGEVRRNEIEQDQSTLGYDIAAVSTMWSWQVTPDLTFTVAARRDWLSLEREGPLPLHFPFQHSDYDRELAEWSHNIGLVYRLSGGDTLRLSAARGVGLPSLLELGLEQVLPVMPGVTLIIAGDPRMEPVIVHNMEAGWDRALPQIDGRLRVAAFWQRNENLRAFAVDGRTLSFAPIVWALLPANIGDSEMHGAELGVEGVRGPWRWDAHYSWRAIDDDLTFPASVSQVAPAGTSPAHVVTAGLTWAGDRLEIGADLRYQSETRQFGQGANLAGAFDVSAHTFVNARLAWRASDAFMVELSGRNLLEQKTVSTGLSPVERSLHVTVRSAF